jgi:hypothetical protein
MSMPRREPPWKESWSWHLLQLDVLITSRVTVTAAPDGTKLNVVLA